MSQEVIELSSDEECTNCELLDKNQKISEKADDSETSIDIDINTLLEKYKISNYIDYKSKPIETVSSSSSEDDISIIQTIKDKYNYNLSLIEDNNYNTDALKNIVHDVDSVEDNEPKPKKSKTNYDKIQKKLEQEEEKTRKQAERERIKAENSKTKIEKQQLAAAYKNLKPEECIKFITVEIDSDLMALECSIDIPNILQNSNITYKISSNVLPLTIMWNRKDQPQLTNINGELQINKNEENCDAVLLIMLWKEFVKLVHENNLISDIKFKKQLMDKKLFLGIYGLENYFRFHKSQKQKIPVKERMYADAPKVSRKETDMALIEIQLLFQISHRFLETPQDVSAIVLQFTKSIAQIPYKLQKDEKTKELNWYVSGDKKDCVKVDKNGNGLHRLWQQQLTQFNMVRLEVAEAITTIYPSPSVLIKAYDQCTSKEEGETLLQDIPIRRAVGPLTSIRKIGPELSRKMYTLFNSVDGDAHL